MQHTGVTLQILLLLGLLSPGAVYQPFDMISMLGFLILMGTVVNNPILIVHQAASNVREQGMRATEAVRDAAESRFRPIAMSTITTIFGHVPHRRPRGGRARGGRVGSR